MSERENWYIKRTRTQNIILVLILLFLIARTISGMWNSPFYKTPADKALNVVKGVAVGVVFLGGLYFYSEKRGKALRGEGDFDADRKFDWLIIVWYLVWFYMWRHYGFWDENSYPGRYFFGFFMGFLVIAFVWFERNIFIDAWWRIVK